MNMNKYVFTEIFRSMQGEGAYTGRNTIWLRWFLCNLQCNGFGQDNPTDPSTYKLPVVDLNKVKTLDDLPVLEYGCDSAYSWAKKFKHLARQGTAKEIALLLKQQLISDSNPTGQFLHPVTQQRSDLCFTGGEPLLAKTQNGIIEVISEFMETANMPKIITVETNGTQNVSQELTDTILSLSDYDTEWFWSVSPKLFNVSGEKPNRAIKPEAVANYTGKGQLKFVVNNKQETWDELDVVVNSFRMHGITWPVYVMPVGSLKEHQEQPEVIEIVKRAIEKGYHISGRLHCHMLGNTIGT